MDLLRLVRLSPGGRPIVDLDLMAAGAYVRERDSFEITPPGRQPRMAAGRGRWAGSTQIADEKENGAVGGRWHVKGATANEALERGRALVQLLERATPGRLLEWKPATASYPVYFEVRGTGTWTPTYRAIIFEQVPHWEFAVSIPVGPLALGAPMDIHDPFDVDSLEDYSFDEGAGSVAVAGGQLVPLTVAPNRKRLYHSARGYTYSDVQVTAKHSIAGSTASYEMSVSARRIDANNYLFAYVSGSNLQVWKRDGGANSALGGQVITALAANSTYWLRLRTEGNLVIAEHWTSEPTPGGAPAASVVVQLNAADRAKFGAGVQGRAGLGWWVPATLGDRVDDLRIEPFTYRTTAVLPDVIDLGGLIPGDEPALADLHVGIAGAAPVFALLAWAEKPPVHNYSYNDLSAHISGWHDNADAGYGSVAGSVLLHEAATVAPAGPAEALGRVRIDHNANFEGGGIRFYRRFKRGVPYTVIFDYHRSAGGPDHMAELGVPGSGLDRIASANVMPTQNAWATSLPLTWVPSDDRGMAALMLKALAATAGTLRVANVRVFEGTVFEPKHGRGGAPPFGVIDAANADPSTLAGWAVAAGVGTFRSEWGLSGVASGSGSASAEFWVDPALLADEDFEGGEVSIEAWARLKLPTTIVTPRLALSVLPEDGTLYGFEEWEDEQGSPGRSLALPSAGTPLRPHRAGALRLKVDRARPRRVRIRVVLTWGTGSTGTYQFDTLHLAPRRRRVASPTRRTLDTSYPRFSLSLTEWLRIVRSDLSGALGKPPHDPAPANPGVAGADAIALPVGAAQLLAHFSEVVPDDPATGTATETRYRTFYVHAAVTPRYHLARGGS